jgi:hypothetical protein
MSFLAFFGLFAILVSSAAGSPDGIPAREEHYSRYENTIGLWGQQRS